MQTASRPILIVILAAALGLVGCDFSEQNVDWEPGNSLIVRGPVDEAGGDVSEPVLSEEGHPIVIQPIETYFFVEAFTIEKEYDWSVDGTPASELENAEVLNDGQFLRVSFSEPGTHTIEVDTDNLSGTQIVVVQNEPVEE